MTLGTHHMEATQLDYFIMLGVGVAFVGFTNGVKHIPNFEGHSIL